MKKKKKKYISRKNSNSPQCRQQNQKLFNFKSYACLKITEKKFWNTQKIMYTVKTLNNGHLTLFEKMVVIQRK